MLVGHLMADAQTTRNFSQAQLFEALFAKASFSGIGLVSVILELWR